jgi:hypothetical protein
MTDRLCLVRLLRWLTLVIALAGAARAKTAVFRDGQILLPVFVAAESVPEERAAAEELVRVLGLMSGLEWSVRTENDEAAGGIFIGRTRAAAARGAPLVAGSDLLELKAGETGPDSFRIRVGAGRVLVEAASPEATGFAVAWLLQQEGGVRWYVPGPLGEVIPRRAEWTLRDFDVTRAPVYRSREIYDLSSPDAKSWAERNGLRGRLDYSHALNHVFLPTTLAENPSWTPLVRGQRYFPATVADYHWQPNLALPEVADFAARAAVAVFDREPGRASVSLGINDTMRFDQSAATRAVVEPLRYFRGMPDYSPLVFTFMNRAAEAVAATGPGRYLGCLAYFWCEAPPPFAVHPNVVPYVTTDRSQYYDAAYRAADLALMSKWQASGVKAFGLWEYAEGAHFLVPRVPLAALAEGVREGARRGARGYFAEVGAQWGFDAFKVWLLARLLWEPELSPAELADEFYPGYFGAAAAPMRRFFERCEEQWMAQAGPPDWLKFYQQEDQTLLFPPVVRSELRDLITAAEERVRDDPVVAPRVGLTSRAFAVTEAYARFDDARRELAVFDLVTGANEGLAERISRLRRAEEEFRARFASAGRGDLPAMTSVALGPFLRNDPVPRLLWLAGRKEPSAPRQILRTAGAEEVAAWRRFAAVIESGAWAEAKNLTQNPVFADRAQGGPEPEFLYPRGGVWPAVWEVKAMPTETGRVGRVANGPTARALRIEGGWDTQVFQWVPAVPGRLYAATAQLRGNSGPGNDAGLFLTFLTKARAVTGTHRMQSLPKGLTAGWRDQALAEVAPGDAGWVGVGLGASRQSAGDWLEAASVELRGVDLGGAP